MCRSCSVSANGRASISTPRSSNSDGVHIDLGVEAGDHIAGLYARILWTEFDLAITFVTAGVYRKAIRRILPCSLWQSDPYLKSRSKVRQMSQS